MGRFCAGAIPRGATAAHSPPLATASSCEPKKVEIAVHNINYLYDVKTHLRRVSVGGAVVSCPCVGLQRLLQVSSATSTPRRQQQHEYILTTSTRDIDPLLRQQQKEQPG